MVERHLELRHWRAFVAAAQAGHFGAAAEQLGISQPALSQLIRTLEAGLGVALFDRAARRARPNQAGAALLPQAQAVIAQADLAARTGAAIGRRGHRAIAAGYVGSSAFHPQFARLIRAIGGARPAIKLLLDQCSATVQVRNLIEERFDFGIVRAPLPTLDPAIASLTLARERMVMAVGAPPAGRARSPWKLASFADRPFVQYLQQPSGGLRSLMIGACQQAGFEPRIVQTVPQIATMLCLVGAGVGVALVPASMARFNVPGVHYLPLEEAVMTDFTLLYRRSDTAPALRSVLRIARGIIDKTDLSK
ncbi:MAG: hypothetical protein B7Z78_00805 [Rhodospirillales bacterium 20-60-12]|nr:MAG: hypothetical protein B7Z78_00805 [Rhodospirillales bacterium 20-60-12]HQT66714.1 LysR family transcriptional regulator [Acetobacteraceae bacterium]HQU00856.1 LysR family transcriptional regulator [Acetobacteraceae bacterium]